MKQYSITLLKFFLLLFVMLVSFSAFAQDDYFYKKRTLTFDKVTDDYDSFEVRDTSVNVYYRRDSTIEMFQKFWTTIKNGDTLRLNESYFHTKRKFKEWYISQYKDSTVTTFKLDKLGYTSKHVNIISTLHGKSYAYNSKGQIIGFVEYENDVQKDIHTNFDYYLNGQLMRVIEYKTADNSIWNIIDYRFPNGEKHTDYGDFKDGTGNVFHLNENGEWCKATIYINGKRVKNK